MKFLSTVYIIIRTLLVSLLILLPAMFFFAFFARIPVEVTDMDKYLQTYGRFSEFLIFPEKEQINGEVIKYHYRSILSFGDGQQEVYLEVVYSKEDFDLEVERLENVTYYFKREDTTNAIYKDDMYLFNYTTYISYYNYFGRYEYACVDPTECRIVYVSLHYRNGEDISFDRKYLPKSYVEYGYDSNSDPYHFATIGSKSGNNMPD